MEGHKETCKKLRLRIRLEERIRKIVKLITQIPAKLDGTEVDPIGKGVDWQERDYDLAYKIRTQIRAGYGSLKFLTNSAILSVEGLLIVKIFVAIAVNQQTSESGFH